MITATLAAPRSAIGRTLPALTPNTSPNSSA